MTNEKWLIRSLLIGIGSLLIAILTGKFGSVSMIGGAGWPGPSFFIFGAISSISFVIFFVALLIYIIRGIKFLMQ